jgi:hypothetical protein
MNFPPKERFFLILSVLFAIALAAGCGKRGPREFASREGVEKRTRLVLIGIDGLEPRLLDKYLKQGKMPVLERLIENGAQSTIQCVAGMTSPVVWTSVATGVMPEKHGITGFTVDDLPVTSTIRRVPTFWNMLAQCGILTATVGWQVSWPAEKDSGIVISDRAYWGDFQDKIQPSDAIDLSRYRRKYFTDLDDLSKFTSYPFDPDYESLDRDDPAYAVNFLLERRLMDVYVRDTMYTDITMEVVEKHNPEVLAVYFHGVDYTGHGFWKWYQPRPFLKAGWTIPEGEPDLLAEIIPRYYAYTDSIIGRILDYVGGDPLVILLSDHGFGPRTKLTDSVTGEKTDQPAGLGDFITGNHRSKAVLIASGPQVEKNALPDEVITHLDILPTMLWALGVVPPDHLPGRILSEFFEAEFDFERKIRVPDAAARGTVERTPKESEHDEAILENLRSLGYIK